MRVPRGFAARMRRGDPCDPLLRQVLPVAWEDEPASGFVDDPVADGAASCGPGILQKYAGRVLLTLTGACAVHCRYCFRRHYPYGEAHPLGQHRNAVLDSIRGDPAAREVILSGGDPLSLTDARLAPLAREIVDISHVRTLRLHTRLPVVLPERVCDELLAWLGTLDANTVMVIHANHPNEIDACTAGALRRLGTATTALLNQSVLLAGVNDDPDVLAGLSEALLAAGVTPYYLHMLDPVAGAAHFHVEEERAQRIIRSLRERLPGYLVPRLVREVPGAPSKVPV